MPRPYMMSAAASAQRQRAGRRGGRARLGWRKPNPAPKDAALSAEYAARKAYAETLKRLHANRRPSRALAEVGRFNPRKETYIDWWIRWNEAQRPTA